MSKNVSFRDVLHALKHTQPNVAYNEVDLLQVENDGLTAAILFQFGVDTNKPIEIYAANHRDMNNNVGVGYIFSGSQRIDEEWMREGKRDLMDRISGAAYTDPSLAAEMCKFLSASVNFNLDSGMRNDGEDAMEEKVNQRGKVVKKRKHWVDPDYEKNSCLISTLEQVKKQIRG